MSDLSSLFLPQVAHEFNVAAMPEPMRSIVIAAEKKLSDKMAMELFK